MWQARRKPKGKRGQVMGKLNIDKIRNRQAETAKGGGSWWKPAKGKNVIRIFKFSHEVTKQDVAMHYFKKDELGETMDELDRAVTLHYNVEGQERPVISNKTVMLQYADLKDSSSEADKERAQKMRPTRKYYLNVLDINDQESGIKVWGAPKSVYNDILNVLMEEDYGGEDELFGIKGTDFLVQYNSDAGPAEMYKVLPRPGGKSEKLSKDFEGQVHDLYAMQLSSFGTVMAEETEEAAETETPAEEPEEAPKASNGKKSAEEEVDDWLTDKPAPAKKKNGGKR